MKSALELNPQEARAFFLKEESYVNFDLPSYFTFNDVLKQVSAKLASSNIKSYFKEIPGTATQKGSCHDPAEVDCVNYQLLSNKDGEFAWRPYEIIHPALYVSLVHLLTTDQNWKAIKGRFENFSSLPIRVESIPVQSTDSESDKAAQVKRWWTNVEQESLRLGLRFQFIFDADITNCYGSIYTHSISWAMHTREVAKAEKKNKDLLGNQIDRHIQMMRCGQTNGIPQGSVLMDFIAELVLGYADTLISEKLASINRDEFEILRYRDDYRVFTNNPELGRKIIKFVSEELSKLGLKLNTQKTKQNHDPILASIKADKIDELFVPKNKMSLSKWLIQIYATSSAHPNSGKVARQLSGFYDAIRNLKKVNEQYDDLEVMISITTNLAIQNPKTYQWSMAILSKLIALLDKTKKNDIISAIQTKFERIPNTGLLDVWLQRLTYKIDNKIEYQEPLTRLVGASPYPGNIIWNSDWLKSDFEKIVTSTPIVSSMALEKMPKTIERPEVELFKRAYF